MTQLREKQKDLRKRAAEEQRPRKTAAAGGAKCAKACDMRSPRNGNSVPLAGLRFDIDYATLYVFSGLESIITEPESKSVRE
jgi:hypothetical protein